MTATIHLIRHGETDWNVIRRMQGHGGVGLNDTGRQQAQQAADTLEPLSYRGLYASDLERALETAQIIGRKVNLEPVADPRLRERGAGVWEGLLLSELQTFDPELRDRVRRDPINTAPPGGETFQEVADRMQAALSEIAEKHHGEHVVVVSHGLAIGIVRAILAGESIVQGIPMRPENAEITRFEWPPSGGNGMAQRG